MEIEYRLIEQCSKEALRVEVEKLLHLGWSFVGGGSTSLHQKGITGNKLEVGYLQTMVHYKG